jgi:hypothetical protein
MMKAYCAVNCLMDYRVFPANLSAKKYVPFCYEISAITLYR